MANVLEARKRVERHHSTSRQLRRKGYIPGVVYGYQTENTPIYVSGAEFEKLLREEGRNAVFSLDVEGMQRNVMLHEVQTDHLKNKVIHVDFLAVNMSQDVDAEVRVVLSEECAGVKDGGVLQQALHELSITAKPNEIPDAITVDVSNLQVGENISVGDIRGQYGFTINHDDTETICSVLPPRQEEEISTGEQQESGTPKNLEGRETNEAADPS
ncbi:50S ribosomal protein L25 [Weizmannia acidilactici]|uniref:Large ribosomal subunit protein bL25 n=1 Tax=Weizmannia acidilactici TaxID=2607726 RepID=A0A5J4JN67_9BACI|nr:50S ribosomal protein L25/general stress protein Ctc [Weizmannia acidilactici]GER67643.1 50S ribosomal protein L25 [Weizmannia acidilactici]GER71827.1 50S ribosomal protein L25 [Weizmannia acidilactici]GER75136.1 50S ribosomal protein L25 [Weizmannia acidilactici]